MTDHPIKPCERSEPPAEGNAAPARVTRRQVLISGAAAGATLGGLVVLRHPATASGMNNLSGVIAGFDAPDILRLRTHNETRIVKILQGAAICRAAAVIDGGAAFAQGEEIVAEGSWAGSVFNATALHTLHRVVEARVIAKDGQRVRTDQGVIALTAEARPRDGFAGHALPPERVVPGMGIAVLGRTDPRTGTLIAEFISDRNHASPAR